MEEVEHTGSLDSIVEFLMHTPESTSTWRRGMGRDGGKLKIEDFKSFLEYCIDSPHKDVPMCFELLKGIFP